MGASFCTVAMSDIWIERTMKLYCAFGRCLVLWNWWRKEIKSCDILIILVNNVSDQENSLTLQIFKWNTWIGCSVVTRVNVCILVGQLIDLQGAVLQDFESQGIWRHHPASLHQLRNGSKASTHAPADRGAGFSGRHTTRQSNSISNYGKYIQMICWRRQKSISHEKSDLWTDWSLLPSAL